MNPRARSKSEPIAKLRKRGPGQLDIDVRRPLTLPASALRGVIEGKLKSRVGTHRQGVHQRHSPGVRTGLCDDFQFVGPNVEHVFLSCAQAAMKQIHVTQELQHKGCGRMVVDLIGASLLLDPALIHHHNSVGDLHRLVLIMGNKDAGDMNFIMQTAKPATQLLSYFGIQCPKWLIEEQHLGLDRQSPCQCNALALAAR